MEESYSKTRKNCIASLQSTYVYHVSTHPPLKPLRHEFLHVPVPDDVGWPAQNHTVSQHGRGVKRDAVAFGSGIAGAVEAGGVAVSGAVGFVGVVVGVGELEGSDGGAVDAGVFGLGAVDLAVIGAGTIDSGVIDGNTVGARFFGTRTIDLTIIDAGILDAGAVAHTVAQLEVIKQLHGRILLLITIRRALPQELHPVAVRHCLELETGFPHFLEQLVPREQVWVAHVVDHWWIRAVDSTRLWA